MDAPIKQPVDVTQVRGHAIIAGFGVPGRAVGEVLLAKGTPFCVIEMNVATIDRCTLAGIQMIPGDVRLKETLQKAGIEHASLFAVTVPSEASVLEAVKVARELNPNVHIVARCHFVS